MVNEGTVVRIERSVVYPDRSLVVEGILDDGRAVAIAHVGPGGEIVAGCQDPICAIDDLLTGAVPDGMTEGLYRGILHLFREVFQLRGELGIDSSPPAQQPIMRGFDARTGQPIIE